MFLVRHSGKEYQANKKWRQEVSKGVDQVVDEGCVSDHCARTSESKHCCMTVS